MNLKNILITFLSTFMILAFSSANAWTLKNDFNNRTVGSNVYGGGNGFDDAAGDTVVSNCAGFAQDGNCAKMSIKKGHDGWGTWGGRIKFSSHGFANPKRGSEIWVSVKVYSPIGFDYTADPQLKFLRLHTTSATTSNEGYNDFQIVPKGGSYFDPVLGQNVKRPPFQFYKEQQGLIDRFGTWGVNEAKNGVWATYEMYLKLDNVPAANGGMSKVRIWKDGKLLADLNNIQTLLTSQSYLDTFLIFTYWNGGTPTGSGTYPTQDQSLYIDDLIITTDKPAKTDINGNPMIGGVYVSPNPPTQFSVK